MGEDQSELPPSARPAYNQRVPERFASAIDASTRYCAVYGHPIKHSASPAFQNAGLAALGLDWRYLAFDVRPEDLRAAVAGAQAMRYLGINLTVPHKLLAVEIADVLDASAQVWGAVNTLRFEAQDAAGEWHPLAQFAPDGVPDAVRVQGFNTDADAITQALREDLNLETRGARVLLLGAGGAGRVAALKLASEGVAELFLVNRTASKAEAVAEEIYRRFPQVAVRLGYPPTAVDLVLNATSLGLKPADELPFDREAWSPAGTSAAFDMVYRPAETPFLQAARAAGCRGANGIGMLLYQGVRALELWTGRPAPVAVMREALVRNVYGSVTDPL
jgi:shikimate dehydrogenase